MKRKLHLNRLLLFCALMVVVIHGKAQELNVSGGITSSEDGTPLAGVNIVVEGTSKGTVSDNKGRYSLAVPNGKATLVFSFTGFTTQTISVGDKHSINIVMARSTNQLTEVTVTALGVTKQKRTVGYSTQELAKKDLSDARDVNLANYLTGKVAGVQVSLSAGGVGGSSKVIIRGISSLTGENQPLYVVDGIPLDNTKYGEGQVYTNGRDFGDGIGNLNPQDIESLNVLKGPNATPVRAGKFSYAHHHLSGIRLAPLFQSVQYFHGMQRCLLLSCE